MKVAMSVAEHELEMAHLWFDWVCELGGTDGHSLFLIPASGVDIKSIIPKADKAFGRRVTIIVDYEAEKGDWQNTEPMRSASGPNSSFRQVAWHFYLNKLGTFFWCELDCVPLKKDWLDRLEAEYKSCGKPFMGAHVEIDNVPEHMSGNAIYPTNVPEEAPTLVQRTEWTPRGQEQSFELAFDISGAREVIPKAHWTTLIQHKFRYEGFKSRNQFDEVIDPNAVMFHSCKDGSIYKYLRGEGSLDEVVAPYIEEWKALSGTAGTPPVEAPISGSGGSAAPPTQPILENGKVTDTVNRTYSYSDILSRVVKEPTGLPPLAPPWQNKKESETEVRMLCQTLALFCKSPVYKHRVREALREAKIIK